jgi:hypothetical protein
MFTRKIELEKRRVAELDKQIQQMNSKVGAGRGNQTRTQIFLVWLSARPFIRTTLLAKDEERQAWGRDIQLF